MNKMSLILMLIISLSMYTIAASPVAGSEAPDFKLPDQNGAVHSLKDYRGQWLVLYFYPKDDTPGCTIEAKKFRDDKEEFIKRNAVVLGISLDDVDSHLDFSQTLGLNFSLLADTKAQMAKNYQVLNGFGIFSYSRRETFIIDPDGKVAHHFNEVDPEMHSSLVLKKLDQLKDF